MNDLATCEYSKRLIEKLLLLDTESELDIDLVKKAIAWAKHYHEGQFRKSGEPFYTHPLEVAYMIADHKLKTDVIVASILHDIIEDTEVTFEMIIEGFGPRIAEMVDRLTRDRPDGTKLSVEEILNNAYYLKDLEVLLIKLVDRLHNMSTLGAISAEKQRKTAEETLKRLLTVSIYLTENTSKMLGVEQYIYDTCAQYIKTITEKKTSSTDMWILGDSAPLPSLISQNKIFPNHILLLQAIESAATPSYPNIAHYKSIQKKSPHV